MIKDLFLRIERKNEIKNELPSSTPLQTMMIECYPISYLQNDEWMDDN